MRSLVLLVVTAVAVWAYCGAIMGVGMAVMSVDATLVVHLIAAPIGAAIAAWLFQRHVGGIAPLPVAFAFVSVALALDLFLVSMVILRSFEMFTLMGVWLPMAFIFAAAWLAGLAQRRLYRHA